MLNKYLTYIVLYEEGLKKVLKANQGSIFELEHLLACSDVKNKGALVNVLSSLHDEKKSNEEKAQILESCYKSCFEKLN